MPTTVHGYDRDELVSLIHVGLIRKDVRFVAFATVELSWEGVGGLVELLEKALLTTTNPYLVERIVGNIMHIKRMRQVYNIPLRKLMPAFAACVTDVMDEPTRQRVFVNLYEGQRPLTRIEEDGELPLRYDLFLRKYLTPGTRSFSLVRLVLCSLYASNSDQCCQAICALAAHLAEDSSHISSSKSEFHDLCEAYDTKHCPLFNHKDLFKQVHSLVLISVAWLKPSWTLLVYRCAQILAYTSIDQRIVLCWLVSCAIDMPVLNEENIDCELHETIFLHDAAPWTRFTCLKPFFADPSEPLAYRTISVPNWALTVWTARGRGEQVPVPEMLSNCGSLEVKKSHGPPLALTQRVTATAHTLHVLQLDTATTTRNFSTTNSRWWDWKNWCATYPWKQVDLLILPPTVAENNDQVQVHANVEPIDVALPAEWGNGLFCNENNLLMHGPFHQIDQGISLMQTYRACHRWEDRLVPSVDMKQDAQGIFYLAMGVEDTTNHKALEHILMESQFEEQFVNITMHFVHLMLCGQTPSTWANLHVTDNSVVAVPTVRKEPFSLELNESDTFARVVFPPPSNRGVTILIDHYVTQYADSLRSRVTTLISLLDEDDGNALDLHKMTMFLRRLVDLLKS